MAKIRNGANPVRTAPRTRLLIGLLAIGAVAWWWATRTPPSEAPTAAAVATSTNAPGPAGPEMPAHPSAGPGPSPSPLPDASFEAHALSLAQRADAGDSRAACRLAAELIRCRQDAAFLAEVADPQSPLSDRLAREGKLDQAISLDERMLVMSQQQRQCRALPEGLIGRAGHYLAQAARAGEPEAMILYVEGQHFPQSGMALLADPGFEAWRRDTPAMAQALLQGGHPEAVFILALAYGDDETWFGGLVPDDPVLNEAYSQLLRRLVGSAGRSRPSPLDAEGTLRARTLAEDWHARHFGNRRIDKSELTRRLTLMTHRRPESSPAPCET